MPKNFKAENYIVDTTTTILREFCENEKDQFTWDDQQHESVASISRRYIVRKNLCESTEFIRLSGEHLGYYMSCTHNFLYSSLLRTVAACFGLYILKPSGPFYSTKAQSCQAQFREAIEDDSSKTQEHSLSGKKWSERLINAATDDKFREEAKSVFQRYFEYAARNPEEILDHAMD